jgi:octaprenyl-diphosphate synthase
MLITRLRDVVSTDLNKVDKLIMSSLYSDIPLVQDIGKYIIEGGGKRLRPLIVLISANACGYVGIQQVTLATVIEFIHTATLLHDDVVDGSMLRRGNATANNKWGNEAAVLVGDFLYSRAFQLMVTTNNVEILRIIANATNTIAEGEVLQLLHQHNPETTEKNYLHVIRCKTAKLFEAAAEVGAVLANTPPHIQQALAQYGLHLGTAYQLIDDLLDYQSDSEEFGKLLGNDLAEGKPTMPLIYLLQHGSPQQKALVTAAISNPDSSNLNEIQHAIMNSQALEYTLAFARREINLAKQAISELDDSSHKNAALDLADFVVNRNH